MIKEYKTIDMADFCDIPIGSMYIILSERKREMKVVKRVKVPGRRYLDLECDTNEPIRVLIKKEGTVTFDTYEIPCYGGIYDLVKFFAEIKISLPPCYQCDWRTYKKELENHVTTLIFSKYALIEGLGDDCIGYRIIPNTPIKIEGTDKNLHYAVLTQPKQDSNGNMYNIRAEELLDKCLRGEAVTEWDFIRVVDDEKEEVVRLKFSDLDIRFEGKVISVRKKLNKNNPKEEVSFTFLKERVVFPSMFLSLILQADSNQQLLEKIAKYYV